MAIIIDIIDKNPKGTVMKTSTIAEAKNNLSHLIHQVEGDEPVHITRYGKPVAVMMSEAQYNALATPTKSLNAAILNWRSKMENDIDCGLTETELSTIRNEATAREFTWDE